MAKIREKVTVVSLARVYQVLSDAQAQNDRRAEYWASAAEWWGRKYPEAVDHRKWLESTADKYHHTALILNTAIYDLRKGIEDHVVRGAHLDAKLDAAKVARERFPKVSYPIAAGEIP